MPPTTRCPSNFRQFCAENADLSNIDLAEKYGRTPQTIGLWKRAHGIKNERTADHPDIDALIREGKSTTEIMAATGWSKSTVNKRKRETGHGSNRRYVTVQDKVEKEPVFPPEVLLERLLEVKARRLGQPLSWMKSVWAKGQGGQADVGGIYDMKRGYFGIGIYHTKTEVNVGTLWRSAHNFGAEFIFTIGRRYKRQASDTTKAWKTIPLYHYESFDDFREHIPLDCQLIAIEQSDKSTNIAKFSHPERAIYLLGAEDHGIPAAIQEKCQGVVHIDTPMCLNVATAGSIVMYDRSIK